VETASIAAAFPDSAKPLRIGSVKGNLGHLETGAAAASIVKVLLMLKNRCFYPTAGHDVPNEKLGLKELGLYHHKNPCAALFSLSAVSGLRVEMSCDSFPDNIKDPLIGINSFGFGGANGFLVLSHPRSSPAQFPALDRENWCEELTATKYTSMLPRQFMALPLSIHYEDVGAQKMTEQWAALPQLAEAIAIQATFGDHSLRFR